MSNIQTVKRAYEAFGRFDIDAVLAVLDPEIEWVEPELEGLLYGGIHHGVEAVAKDVFALMPQTWEKVELQPEEWIDGGDAVVVIGQFSARAWTSRGQLVVRPRLEDARRQSGARRNVRRHLGRTAGARPGFIGSGNGRHLASHPLVSRD